MKSIVKCNLWHNPQRGESDQYLIEEEIEDHIHMIMRDNTDCGMLLPFSCLVRDLP
jgi:hypothetical protein